ncbi:cardiolipin synthase [Planomicrobium okeanokoites]|uniref:cardiolipin synthase n=1 Tax=Planomicrobium okeanokoites TaxID=244 RepID=UPI000E3C3ADC|nr:cardiolipin synthase [Planomicrobium okeanokoites]TAA70121.1 cardiolipin synthase [Planomicrobium okeanokoites]
MSTLSNLFIILNIVLAFFILFFERKTASSAWAWILILFFIPILGFILYLLFGKPLRRDRLKRPAAYENDDFEAMVDQQLKEIKSGESAISSPVAKEMKDIVQMNMVRTEAPLSTATDIIIYNDGANKFEALFNDIRQAQNHIHLQYFIMKDDDIGKRLLALLTEKAQQGVKVLFLYDDLGSRSLPKDFFEDLNRAGGRATAFLPAILSSINPRLNHRNHRKLVVVDGKVGYIGGFNVGDEYIGRKKEFGYWRDTHLRVEGEIVHSLQNRFFIDWNQAAAKYPMKYAENYFPKLDNKEGVPMQIVASGPLETHEDIKNGFLKMIHHARESIYLQTPYFIPDKSIMDALKTASLGGVDVQIMIPHMADHMFVHSATLSFVRELLPDGVKVYSYKNGFLHAKTLIVDEKAYTVGSANMDIRSFALNFELNAFVYGVEASRNMADTFFQDKKLSVELTEETFKNQTWLEKGKQDIAKLVSPIL